jgi:hypothetical protein
MRFCRQIRFILATIWLAMLLSACSGSWGPRDVADSNNRADLLIYFKKETRDEEIEHFWTKAVLSIPDARGGFHLLPGISGVMGNPSVTEHQSLRVDFWANATQTQRAEVKRRVLASPLVFTILEDTIPSSVTQLGDTGQ